MTMVSFPQIVVGTYEEFVLGYKPELNDEDKFKMIQTFVTHSHQASVRCVAAHEQTMASSGADEYINIYNMHAMEVSSVINYHNATVTCLEFTPDGSHLVTANQNGDIAIFRCRDWTLVKLWKEAHKHANGVTSISIHPSGSLLITTGADNIVRFWNLIKGRQAYATNFSKKCSVEHQLNFSLWSIDGDYYAVCVGNKVEIYKTETAAIVYEIQSSRKVTSATFAKKTLICIGTEEGSLEVHSFKEKKLLLKTSAHKTRVKCLKHFSVSIVKKDKTIIKNYLVSTESKGILKFWFLKKIENKCSLELKSEVDIECRITCLAAVFPKSVKEEKVETPETENPTQNNKTPLNDVENRNGDNTTVVLKSKKASKKKNKKIKENGNPNLSTDRKNQNCVNKTVEEKKNKTPEVNRKRKSSETINNSNKKKLFNSSPSSSSKKHKKRKFSNSFDSKNVSHKKH